MSANNYDICPQCRVREELRRERLRKKADDAYGKIPVEEYRKLLARVNAPLEEQSTLREDWEIGVDRTGEFYCHYRGSCQECGFVFVFKHEEKVAINKGLEEEDN